MLDPKPLIIEESNLEYFDKILSKMLLDIKHYAVTNKEVMPISMIWKLNVSRMSKLGIDLIDLEKWLVANNKVEYLQNKKMKGFIIDKEYWDSVGESAHATQRLIINSSRMSR